MRISIRILFLMTLFTLLHIVMTSPARAVGLGLTDGTYNVTLDFTNDALDANGVMTITGGLVTDFQLNDPKFASWVCGSGSVPCSSAIGFISINNDTFTFIRPYYQYYQGVYQILSFTGVKVSELSTTPPLVPRVPEPISMLLMLFGLIALGLERLLSKQRLTS